MEKDERPILPWRFQTDNRGAFDELVVGHGLHVEMMDWNQCWLAINRPDGERWSFFINMDAEGNVTDIALAEDPESGEHTT